MSLASLSKFKRMSACTVMVTEVGPVLSKYPPASRCVSLLDAAGTETRLTVTEEAMEVHAPEQVNAANDSVKVLAKGRVYEFQFPSTCLLDNDKKTETLYDAKYFIRSRFPLQVSSSSIVIDAGAMTGPFTPFADFSTLQHKGMVNTVGVCSSPPMPVESPGFPKVRMVIASEESECTVDLSDHWRALDIKKGDVVAFKRLQVYEAMGQKLLQTHFSSVVMVNPRGAQFEVNTEEGPKRKALRASFTAPVTVAAAQANLEGMNHKWNNEKVFTIVGQYKPFTKDALLKQAPFYNRRGSDELRVLFTLTDDSGTLSTPGTAFASACTLLKMSVKDAVELWEDCESGEEAQEAYVSAMNANSTKSFRFLCKAVAKEWRSKTQVNLTIDAVEEVL